MFFQWLLLPILVAALARIAYTIILVPLHTRNHFLRQGIRGPAYRPVFGNTAEFGRLFMEAMSKPISMTHDVLHRLDPPYHRWAPMYGKTFLFWFGWNPTLAVADPGMIKQVLMNTDGSYGKIEVNPSCRPLFAEGLAGLSGDTWALHRRIISQAFTVDRVKGWVPDMIASMREMMERWEEGKGGAEEFEIDIHQELHNFSAEVISKTAFGASFEEGKKIFTLQEKQIELFSIAARSVYIPGFRFLPTKKNRERWRLERETRESVRRLIETNANRAENSKNLLSMMMSPHKNRDGVEERLGLDEVINECKTVYFAGKDTTASFLTWTVLLLARHQDWQAKAREEVIRVCGEHEDPQPDSLSNLKMINMILHESLRLYTPSITAIREAYKDVKLGDLDVPAGTQLQVALHGVHHDPENWGEDANEFNPSRFSEPRKSLASFCAFGLGPRICVAQNLALAEAKITVAMLVRRYSFVLAPTYVHAPAQFVTLQPQFGAHILLRKIAN